MYICSKLHSLKLFKTDCLSSCKITRKKKKRKDVGMFIVAARTVE